MPYATAPGDDGVQAFMVKHGGQPMLRALYQLFAVLWENEVVPSDWHRNKLCMLFKKGSRVDIGNYRLIALSSIISKVMSRVLNRRIYDWMEKNDLIPDQQYGFRAHRGCPEAAWVLSEVVQGRIDEKKATFLCFVDVKKAYDRVRRNMMFVKLHRQKVSGKLFRMVREWYRDNQSRIEVEGLVSEWIDRLIGLQQGCVMSPILFSIFINGLAFQLESQGYGVRVRGHWVGSLFYADDIVLLATSQEELQKMMAIVSAFCDTWCLSINNSANKTEVMECGRAAHISKSPMYRPSFCYNMQGKEIRRTQSYVYLGVIMTPTRSFSLHSKKVIRSVQQRIGLLKHARLIGRSKMAATPARARILLRTEIAPLTEYASAVWFPSASDSAKLSSLWGSAVKMAIGSDVNVSASAVMFDLEIPPLEVRRQRFVLNMWYDIVCRAESEPNRRMAFRVLQWRYSQFQSYAEGDAAKKRQNWCSRLQEAALAFNMPEVWSNMWTPIEEDKYFSKLDGQERQAVEASLASVMATKSHLSKLCVFSDYGFAGYMKAKDPVSRILLLHARAGALPTQACTASTRWRRVHNMSTKCDLCDCGIDETIEHLLWQCPVLSHVRRSAGFGDVFPIIEGEKLLYQNKVPQAVQALLKSIWIMRCDIMTRLFPRRFVWSPWRQYPTVRVRGGQDSLIDAS